MWVPKLIVKMTLFDAYNHFLHLLKIFKYFDSCRSSEMSILQHVFRELFNPPIYISQSMEYMKDFYWYHTTVQCTYASLYSRIIQFVLIIEVSSPILPKNITD